MYELLSSTTYVHKKFEFEVIRAKDDVGYFYQAYSRHVFNVPKHYYELNKRIDRERARMNAKLDGKQIGEEYSKLNFCDLMDIQRKDLKYNYATGNVE